MDATLWDRLGGLVVIIRGLEMKLKAPIHSSPLKLPSMPFLVDSIFSCFVFCVLAFLYTVFFDFEII